jgi:hypothetical protein
MLELSVAGPLAGQIPAAGSDQLDDLTNRHGSERPDELSEPSLRSILTEFQRCDNSSSSFVSWPPLDKDCRYRSVWLNLDRLGPSLVMTVVSSAGRGPAQALRRTWSRLLSSYRARVPLCFAEQSAGLQDALDPGAERPRQRRLRIAIGIAPLGEFD